MGWYHKYYGVASKEKYTILLGMGNGGGSYGPRVILPDSSETAHAIMGVSSFDNSDNPVFDKASYLPTLIHEFNHSFVNHLITENQKAFENAGSVILPVVRARMHREGYDRSETMLMEALVRASVIRYLKVHDTDTTVAYKELQIQLSKGFVWIGQLVDLLGTYEANRKMYPTLESFMPQIITFYDRIAVNINSINNDYIKSLAHVSSINPFNNGDTSASPATKEIKISFDKPLSGKGSSIRFGKKGKEHYPITKFIGYTDDNKAILLQVDLKPDFEYQFVLTGASFQTADGRPIENYEVNFKTSK